MSKKLLLDKTLIGAVEWYSTAPESPHRTVSGQTWKSQALLDLKRLLNREYGELPEPARRGITFEDAVFREAAKDESKRDRGKYSRCFNSIVDQLEGYIFQKWYNKTVLIDGKEYYLSGKLDALNVESKRIVDLKTSQATNKPFEENKYKESIQHLIYMYLTGYHYFEYIVVLWDEYPKIRSMHSVVIDYTDKEKYFTSVVVPALFERMSDCIKTIEQLELWDVYAGKYSRNLS